MGLEGLRDRNGSIAGISPNMPIMTAYRRIADVQNLNFLIGERQEANCQNT